MGDLAPAELTATGEHPPRSSSMQFLLVLAALWVLFHLVAAGSGVIGSHVLRSVHLGGAIILTLCYKPLAGSWRWIDALLILAVIASTLYLVVRSDAILLSNWFTFLWPERILGAMLFVSLIEAVRRALGWGFVALIAVFVGYAVLGPWIPGVFGHRGLSIDRLIFSFYLGSQGVTGMLIGISASIVALFLIFGEILNASGAGNTFINVALRIGGRLRGGAGMVAVIGSAFMGMINGSAVANVASTGVLTIPLMRRLGFSRNLAGAIEAVASTGGQFMPPIMGPGAFLMAELLGISYLDVAVAALIPSTLFYIGLLLAVWLLAGKNGLQPIPADMIPSRKVTYAPVALMALLLPIGVLVGLVIARFTVQYAVLAAIIIAAVLLVVQALIRRANRTAETGKDAPVAALALAFDLSARNIAYVGMIIAAAQIIVAVINLTGLGVTLSQIIVSLGQSNLMLSLVLTMGVAILLGMPTPAAYAVAAAVLGPPLARLGLEMLPAHLFIYYFACLAAITPPVASAVFAACAISRGSVIPTAGHAILLSLSLFLIPFLFVNDPVLLLEGSPLRIALAVISGMLGVATLTLATIGYLMAPIPAVFRVVLGIAALALIVPGWVSDLVGLLVATVVFGLLLSGQVRSSTAAVSPANRSP
ncbi:TRAP transporter, 4TM/12TM fusion protein [Sulfitobacter brevis]|uniref:TRAP transporter, 4TM/12TM fusion protein n=1 Tax=Sulfitobacter brevis TaxID=74348 RepID=A0A1I2FAZ3_9RHOB|nr:TRAP transporter fused permease subunit [Sulfitobacter brevis]SFF02395.1 TRAP transporter, 4TM/12TM fusion protein [Sulfitobacter brevis]